MAKYRLVSSSRIRRFVPNPTVMLVLVPMFLIITSSVYPAIMSSIENKEMEIVARVMAVLNEKNIDTSSHHTNLPLPSSQNLTPISPIPIDSTLSYTSSSTEPDTSRFETQGYNISEEITSTAINTEGTVNVIWSESDPTGNSEILYKNNGEDFQPPAAILFGPSPAASIVPDIGAAGTNNIHIVWQDDRTGNNEIFYARSTNGGASFEIILNLSNSAVDSVRPSMAVSGNNVHVVWEEAAAGDSEIFYRRSTNGGLSFSSVENLSFNAGFSGSPAIAISGNNLHVVWSDNTPGNLDIFYRRSTNNGVDFGNTKNLSSNSGFSADSDIAASGNNVHVVWEDSTPGSETDILYRRSIDGGSTFPNVIKNLSDNADRSSDPAVAVLGSTIHVVWEDDTPINSHIFYRRSIDGGSTFPNIIKDLSGSDPAFGIDPGIAAKGDNVYVVWEGGGGGDIFYRKSTNDGASFPGITINLNGLEFSTATSRNPAISVS